MIDAQFCLGHMQNLLLRKSQLFPDRKLKLLMMMMIICIFFFSKIEYYYYLEPITGKPVQKQHLS